MLLGIDHVVIAVADPDEAAAQLELGLGLAATGGGRHDTLGTLNRLIWLGESYLELIGAFDRRLAEASWLGAPTLRTLDLGGGLVTWAIATDELERDVAALRRVAPISASRCPANVDRPTVTSCAGGSRCRVSSARATRHS